MATHTDLTTATLPERVTLLGITHLTIRDEAPVHTGEVVRTCTWEFDDLGADLGSLSEADVSRALNRLEADGFVEQALEGETSAVGKGRPRYSLAVDPERVLDCYSDDDRVAGLVAHIRTGGD